MNSIKDILQVEEGEKYACEGQRYPSTAEDPNIPDCLLHARYNRLLPIYVIPDQKRVISGSLKWLSKMSGVESISFMFYDLIFLFQRLLDASPFDIPHKVSYGAAEAHLMRDVYLYLSNVSCRYNFRIYFVFYFNRFSPFFRYHEETESSKCAGGRASRYAHIISDFWYNFIFSH